MADVHHVHHDVGTDRTDSGVAMLVFTLIAILAVAAFAFFAFNGTLFRGTNTPADTGSDVNVQGTIDVPNVTPPATNPGGNVNMQ